mgnify:FL=1
MSIPPGSTPPEGLLYYSREFLASALAADDVLGMRPGFEIAAPVPVMYQVGHSIELALKAYLLRHGVSLRDLKRPGKFGHDLEACFRKAKELGLLSFVDFTDVEVGAMRALNALYHSRQLNYFVAGPKQVPAFGSVQSFCEKLIAGVAKGFGSGSASA